MRLCDEVGGGHGGECIGHGVRIELGAREQGAVFVHLKDGGLLWCEHDVDGQLDRYAFGSRLAVFGDGGHSIHRL